MPEVEVRIVDPATGADVPAGADGELWARGYVVMKGYYEMPDATAAAITKDGWLRSGDQASIDREGRVRITGRIKDIIIRGGENIAPKEVEDVLRTHPAIADASVYAVASEFFGEEVAAALAPASGRHNRAARGPGVLPRTPRQDSRSRDSFAWSMLSLSRRRERSRSSACARRTKAELRI